MAQTGYQTIPLPDGTIQTGLFPTIEWFGIVSKYVDFRNKTVLDLGCCQFSYGIQALISGAQWVDGIDNNPALVEQSKDVLEQWGFSNATVLQADVEKDPWATMLEGDFYDVVICSMLLHWLMSPQEFIRDLTARASEMVFIYRFPQDRVEDTGWRPTLAELDEVVGCEHTAAEKISSTPEQNIMCAVYRRVP